MRPAGFDRILLLALGVALSTSVACGGGSGSNPDDGNGGSTGSGGSTAGGSGGSKPGSGGSGGKAGGGSSGGTSGGSSGGASGDAGGTPGDTGGGPSTSIKPYTPTGAYAFGSHRLKYPDGTARPSGDQKIIDGTVGNFYDYWKKKYIARDCPGGFYLASGGGAGANAANNITTSEAHGYAMIITAIMNEWDPEAHDVFDNLLAMIQKYPSRNTAALMAWGIAPKCAPLKMDDADSASDGDLDMGYALLLAEKIWGNGGKYNYGALAKTMLTALKAGDMNPDTKLAKLGDFVAAGDDSYYYTRGSDFMVDHYRAFAKASGDVYWMGAVDAVYKLVDFMQTNFAPETGLIPDFMMKTNTAMPEQVPLSVTNQKGGLEEGLHTDYDYNSCRVPWRLATDYVVTGDVKVKDRLAKINAFIQKQTGGDPAKIVDGYSLKGEPWTVDPKAPPELSSAGTPVVPGENGCFTSSFGTGAIVDSKNQAWVDAVWKFMNAKKFDAEDEYTNSVNLLNMIVMTGNWWAP
jgi:endo-1,4-beta-D-glucanase Y